MTRRHAHTAAVWALIVYLCCTVVVSGSSGPAVFIYPKDGDIVRSGTVNVAVHVPGLDQRPATIVMQVNDAELARTAARPNMEFAFDAKDGFYTLTAKLLHFDEDLQEWNEDMETEIYIVVRLRLQAQVQQLADAQLKESLHCAEVTPAADISLAQHGFFDRSAEFACGLLHHAMHKRLSVSQALYVRSRLGVLLVDSGRVEEGLHNLVEGLDGSEPECPAAGCAVDACGVHAAQVVARAVLGLRYLEKASHHLPFRTGVLQNATLAAAIAHMARAVSDYQTVAQCLDDSALERPRTLIVRCLYFLGLSLANRIPEIVSGNGAPPAASITCDAAATAQDVWIGCTAPRIDGPRSVQKRTGMSFKPRVPVGLHAKVAAAIRYFQGFLTLISQLPADDVSYEVAVTGETTQSVADSRRFDDTVPSLMSAHLHLGMLFASASAQPIAPALLTRSDLLLQDARLLPALTGADVALAFTSGFGPELPCVCCAHSVLVRHLAAASLLAPTLHQPVRMLESVLQQLRRATSPQATASFRFAAEHGVFAHPLQRPYLTYVPELAVAPLHRPETVPAALKWPTVAPSVRQEILSWLQATNGSSLYADTEANTRLWLKADLLRHGERYVARHAPALFSHEAHSHAYHWEALPKLAAFISSIPESLSCVIGSVRVSIVLPGAFIRPHTGPSNLRLRIHFPVSIGEPIVGFPQWSANDTKAADPRAPFLRIGNQVTTWDRKVPLVLDDSFEHEVWHNGTHPRIVVIMDVWHPQATANQLRAALSPADVRRVAQIERGDILFMASTEHKQ